MSCVRVNSGVIVGNVIPGSRAWRGRERGIRNPIAGGRNFGREWGGFICSRSESHNPYEGVEMRAVREQRLRRIFIYHLVSDSRITTAYKPEASMPKSRRRMGKSGQNPIPHMGSNMNIVSPETATISRIPAISLQEQIMLQLAVTESCSRGTWT